MKHNKNSDAAKEVADQCYGMQLRMLGRISARIYDEEFSCTGVTGGQFGMLTAITLMGKAHAGKLGSVLNMEKSTVSRNLKLMEKKGWITIEHEGRTSTVTITEQGNHIYGGAVAYWRQAQKRIRQLFAASPEKFQIFNNIAKGNV